MKGLFVIAIVTLCACSGSGTPPALTALHNTLRASPIGAAAKSKTPLLFVSDASAATVYIYQLSNLKLVNSVVGLTQPQGECADSAGDVWVTDAGANVIYELSHEGRLEATLTATDYPDGCAWDPSSGDLAVMDLMAGSGASGDVTVYRKRPESSHSYENSQQYYYNFGGYDANGNLFFDGRAEDGTFVLSELPKGAKKASTIAVEGGTIYYPGMVQWDPSKQELIVGDQSCGGIYTASCLYILKVANTTATIEGSVTLQNSSGGQICDLIQGVVYDGQLAGSDNDICGSGPSTTYVWPYPSGGAPTASNAKTDSTPVGAAVSP